MSREVVLVSACLLGETTRYDGRQINPPALIEHLRESHQILSLCPEVLGGLPTPRPAARILGGLPGREGFGVLHGVARVMTESGQDLTGAFLRGAMQVVDLALEAGVRRCYLKDRSPSCAYDPYRRNPVAGVSMGVLAALLHKAGLEIIEVRASSRLG